MLSSVNHLIGASVTATDGEIGQVNAAFFDDQSWTIRYLVVDTGSWLVGREVLISPYAVHQPIGSVRNIDVSLTRQQVQDSPDVDTRQPVSRQHEREYLSYYAYPEYWDGGGLWGTGSFPLLPFVVPTPAELAANIALREREVEVADPHLRSNVAVTGYEIRATDGSIGHVKDFVFDDESWAIRYLVVDTRNWWPGGKKVLVGTPWIDSIDWSTKAVEVGLTRERVKSSPAYDEAPTVTRDFEKRLHAAHNRQGYWD